MCDVKADNSVENSLLEFQKKIPEMREVIQKRKHDLNELRNETDRIFQIVSEAW